MLTIEMQQEGCSSYFSQIYPVKMMLLPTQDKTQQVHVSHIHQVAQKSVIYKECSYKSINEIVLSFIKLKFLISEIGGQLYAKL